MITPTSVTDHSQHLDITFVRQGDVLIWAAGQVAFSFRPADNGVVHSDTLSFNIGTALTSFYSAMPVVAITGMNLTPSVTATSGAVLLPALGVSVFGPVSLSVNGSASPDGVVRGSADGPVTLPGTTTPVSIPSTIGVSARPGGWSVQNVAAEFDASQKRVRLNVLLSAMGNVELTQISYQATIYGFVRPLFNPPVEPPILRPPGT